MKIKLIVKVKDALFGYIFDTGADITIGREIGNTIAPILDSVSRRHAHIFYADGGWNVEDLGSTNGSLVNGKKIEGRVALKAGDALRFGLIDMSVSFEGEAVAATAKVAAPAAELSPVAELEPVEASESVANATVKTSAAGLPRAEGGQPPAAAVKPVAGGLKPGVKPPARPTLPTGLKLPPKPMLKPTLKLPTAKA